ncbi:DUF3667 domain-containing protein [Salinimicrobium sp. GXAS 041]|uniref:DUF3667 domain-containing protein n=1 Tax=Salinimicrobium sp. GXAS 041 TaxID=3400806 RepID=UPI003C7518CE
MESQRKLLKYRGRECLNCFQPLDRSEKYCHYCGQLNSTKKLSFNDFFNEFFAGIFAYDSRIYRTVKALLFNPGKISKDYIEGKRQRYANPYRFYLSASIVFFIIWGLTHDYDNFSDTNSTEEIQEISTEVDSIIANASNTQNDSGISNLFNSRSFEESYISQKELDTMSAFRRTRKKLDIFLKHYNDTKIASSVKALEKLNYPPTSFNKWLYKKAVDLHLLSSNSGLFLNYFLNKLPFIIFFYLPVFALFIWLVYARRPFTYMEHLIFTFHNQTLWFVLFSIAILTDYSFETSWAETVGTLLFLFYLYKAMRKFYKQGRVKTILKFIIINGIFFILAFVAALFSLVASFAVY